MLTVLDILNRTEGFFKSKGVPDARLDAQYIMAHGLKMQRMDLYLNFDKPLSEDDLAILRPLVARRAKREPLQHILGSASFRGWEIKCDKRALIPRPETEVLVDLALESIPKDADMRVLDVGTGTGAIAIAVAKERLNCSVVAMDISDDALSLAKENIEEHGLNNRIELLKGDASKNLPLDFDIIISNPPYIRVNEIEGLQEEVRAFDPLLALDGGEDGLYIVRKMLNQTIESSFKGVVFMELGEGQAVLLREEYEKKLASMNKKLIFKKDMEGTLRFLKVAQAIC